VIAGGLVLSSVAVNRYLQASSSALQRGDSAADGATPAPSELASLERTVSVLITMPGVATATSNVDTPGASAVGSTPSPSPTGGPVSYDVSVIMNPDATADQSANVVFVMTQQLQNARVNLELSSPAGDGHAASVIDYVDAFNTPVARSTVDSVSHAVAVAVAVPGVKSVHVTVPYTWNLASGDLVVEMAPHESHQSSALAEALAHTALADVGRSKPVPEAQPSDAGHVTAPSTPDHSPGTKNSPAPSRRPTPTPTPTTPRASEPPLSSTPTPTPTSTEH